MLKKSIIFVVSGPSGSGKTTISKEILKSIDDIKFSVSFTTREKRDDEINDTDYVFVSAEKFKNMIDNSEFAEWAEVHGNLYGTPIKQINESDRNGIDILLDIDVQGATKIKETFNNCVSIFVVPPSIKELKERLIVRRSENDYDVEVRIKTSKNEIGQIINYDYIIINDNKDKAIDLLLSIIKAERSKSKNIADDFIGKYLDEDSKKNK